MGAQDTVTDPDADILPGLMAGAEGALKALMDRHMHKLHAHAAYMLGDQIMAEDVCQTVFLKTWKMAPNWESGKAKLITWMRRATTNACLDILRKHSPSFTDNPPEQADSSANAVDGLLAEETAYQIKQALSEIQPRQRTAIVLSFYDEISQKEGAQIMEITESAYESLLMRGKKALKAKLSAKPIASVGGITQNPEGLTS